MNSLIEILIELVIRTRFALLYWILFDIIGLICFSIFLSSIVSDVYYSIRNKSLEWFNKSTIVFFVFVCMICCVFYFLYINYSYDQLQYIANFSFFAMIMICIWTIYKTIKIIPKYQDGRISAKPKFFRMSRSKRRKENLKNSSKKER